MQIFIKGQNSEQVLNLSSSCTMESLREEIFSQTLISLDMMTLSHNGRVLTDLSELSELDNIYVTASVLAGGAKHKKKVYTTKKKNKHRHIKEKLATLRVFFLRQVLLGGRLGQGGAKQKRLPAMRRGLLHGSAHGPSQLRPLRSHAQAW